MDRIQTGPLTFVHDPGDEEGPSPVARPAAEGPVRPIHLLADSQLLFWNDHGRPYLERVLEGLPPIPRAAYLGASNGDDPAFYELFTSALEMVGVAECRQIPAAPSAEDCAFLVTADLVLLAGGDVERGWRAFEAGGVGEAVVRRWHAGAALVGVSAGAVQLGTTGWAEGDPGLTFPTFGLVPFVVSAHDEARDWEELRRVVVARGGEARGLGVPRGGGVIYHPDHTVEAVRNPAVELEVRGGEVAASLLMPSR
ncbi:MAG TPA: Type 1 glutamine amidotransferase-like domain-containing protein [Longimicrobium sp.]|nr:Type 1 glutamine amidotransferase-like domain-containing protein [Longimicrobium sp.]